MDTYNELREEADKLSIEELLEAVDGYFNAINGHMGGMLESGSRKMPVERVKEIDGRLDAIQTLLNRSYIIIQKFDRMNK